MKSQGSSVSTVTRLRLDDRDSIPGRNRDFCLRHRVHICSGAWPTSYPMDMGGGGKNGGA